jgi:preprotein translocase subunit Sec61beta
MPTTMAGIIGTSPTSKTGGIEITPQMVVIFTVAVIVIVQVASYIIG